MIDFEVIPNNAPEYILVHHCKQADGDIKYSVVYDLNQWAQSTYNINDFKINEGSIPNHVEQTWIQYLNHSQRFIIRFEISQTQRPWGFLDVEFDFRCPSVIKCLRSWILQRFRQFKIESNSTADSIILAPFSSDVAIDPKEIEAVQNLQTKREIEAGQIFIIYSTGQDCSDLINSKLQTEQQLGITLSSITNFNSNRIAIGRIIDGFESWNHLRTLASNAATFNLLQQFEFIQALVPVSVSASETKFLKMAPVSTMATEPIEQSKLLGSKGVEHVQPQFITGERLLAPDFDEGNSLKQESMHVSFTSDTFVNSLGQSINVGDRIMVTTANMAVTGILRYVGKTQFKEGIWAGVELDAQGMGKNDGTVQGVTYFQCKHNTGLFVPIHKVTKLDTSGQSNKSEHQPAAAGVASPLSHPKKLSYKIPNALFHAPTPANSLEFVGQEDHAVEVKHRLRAGSGLRNTELKDSDQSRAIQSPKPENSFKARSIAQKGGPSVESVVSSTNSSPPSPSKIPMRPVPQLNSKTALGLSSPSTPNNRSRATSLAQAIPSPRTLTQKRPSGEDLNTPTSPGPRARSLSGSAALSKNSPQVTLRSRQATTDATSSPKGSKNIADMPPKVPRKSILKSSSQTSNEISESPVSSTASKESVKTQPLPLSVQVQTSPVLENPSNGVPPPSVNVAVNQFVSQSDEMGQPPVNSTLVITQQSEARPEVCAELSTQGRKRLASPRNASYAEPTLSSRAKLQGQVPHPVHVASQQKRRTSSPERSETHKLQDELTSTKNELLQTQSKALELRSLLESKQTTIISQGLNLESWSLKIQHMEYAANSKEKEILQLQKVNQSMELELNEARNKEEHLKSSLAEESRKCISLESKLGILEKEILHLQNSSEQVPKSEFDSLAEKHEKLLKEVETSQKKWKFMDERLAEAQFMARKLNEEVATIATQLRATESAKESLVRENSLLQATINDLKHASPARQEENDTPKQSDEPKGDSSDDQQQESIFNNSRVPNEALQLEVQTLKLALQTLTEEHKNTSESIERYELTVKQSEHEISRLKLELDTLRKQPVENSGIENSNGRKDGEEDELRHTREEKKALELSLAELQVQISNHAASVSLLEKNMNAAQEQTMQREEQLRMEWKMAESTYEMNLASATREITSLKRERDSLLSDMTYIREEASRLRNQMLNLLPDACTPPSVFQSRSNSLNNISDSATSTAVTTS
jgi:hypothetical protein